MSKKRKVYHKNSKGSKKTGSSKKASTNHNNLTKENSMNDSYEFFQPPKRSRQGQRVRQQPPKQSSSSDDIEYAPVKPRKPKRISYAYKNPSVKKKIMTEITEEVFGGRYWSILDLPPLEDSQEKELSNTDE